jgi:Tfp pilus assembly protein PilF
MRIVFLAFVCLLLQACATTVSHPPSATDLFHDELYLPPSVAINAADALVMTEPMVEYARTKLGHMLGHVNIKDRRLALVDVMYKKGELRLDYDATKTLTASQAFESKKGNCLSLVLLTAAMAKQIGLPIHYQSVVGATDWNKSDNFFMSIGHVNLVLEELPSEFEMATWSADPLVVDFLPPDKASVLMTRAIDESTVLAMFLNNRAVETLIQGNVNDAYWWVKAAILQDPSFINSYITLGVIYRTIHHSEYAEAVLEKIAIYDPDNTTILTNRVLVLRDLGRDAEANELAQRLVKLDKHPPWGYYMEAQAEYQAGHYDNARHLFEKEIARDPQHHEFEYGLALVYDKLHDPAHAMNHLERALELSLAKSNRDFYAAKLEKLKATGSM